MRWIQNIYYILPQYMDWVFQSDLKYKSISRFLIYFNFNDSFQSLKRMYIFIGIAMMSIHLFITNGCNYSQFSNSIKTIKWTPGNENMSIVGEKCRVPNADNVISYYQSLIFYVHQVHFRNILDILCFLFWFQIFEQDVGFEVDVETVFSANESNLISKH